LTENITAEIMQTCLSETRESYAEEIIVELSSSGQGEDVDENVRRLESWVSNWVADRSSGSGDA
jgi:adenylate kinase